MQSLWCEGIGKEGKTLILEVCIDSAESALAAQRGGATRVELCADLEHGGTTPGAGLIKTIRDRISIGLCVMIRPRPGDFFFSDTEFDVMKRDVEIAKQRGADGVVIGLLTSSGEIDVGRTRGLVEMARPMSVTFHRAFDECADLPCALDQLKDVGADRVLTSGGKSDIRENLGALADLVRRSGASLKVMAGGGITFENVGEIVERTRVDEVHVLSAVSTMVFGTHLHSDRICPSLHLVDESKVRSMVDRLGNLSSHSQK